MKLINTTHAGICRGCGERIDIHVDAWWAPNEGLRCTDCGPDFAGEDRRGAATADEDVPGYVAQLKKQIAALEQGSSDDMKGLIERLDRLEAWAIRLSAELGVKGPRD